MAGHERNGEETTGREWEGNVKGLECTVKALYFYPRPCMALYLYIKKISTSKANVDRRSPGADGFTVCSSIRQSLYPVSGAKHNTVKYTASN